MNAKNRRELLCALGPPGAALTSGSWLEDFGYAPVSGTARTVINPDRCRSVLDRRLFGGFLEHLGRAVYGGVYQPGSPLADDSGFRTDVLEQIRGLDVPLVRYPGGNFVSGYDWLDGVGPVEDRSAVHERAWNSTETNRFGTNEFMQWCRRAGAEPMLVFNLGSNTPEMAAAYVEYCNGRQGRWADLRRSHGVESPHGVRYWCLGNELDGPWQIGHMPARGYGDVAATAARRVRAVDPGVQLVAAGSSNTELPSYLDWEREMLRRCYHEVDAVSLHNYYGNTDELTGEDTARYLAMNLDMERQVQEVAAVCDSVQGELRSKKKLWLAFDEWNVWYRARTPAHMDGQRQVAPRLLEETYNLEDALLVGGFVNTLLRRSDRVRIGCLAQLVNVIAPLVTGDEGLLKQSIFHPYAWALAHARGKVLDLRVESETYPIRADGLRHDFARDDEVPFVDVSATLDEARGEVSIFALNRDLHDERDLALEWRGLEPLRTLACETLTGPNLKAFNTFEAPYRVQPQALDAPRPGRSMTLKLPAASYSLFRFALQ